MPDSDSPPKIDIRKIEGMALKCRFKSDFRSCAWDLPLLHYLLLQSLINYLLSTLVLWKGTSSTTISSTTGHQVIYSSGMYFLFYFIFRTKKFMRALNFRTDDSKKRYYYTNFGLIISQP